MITLEQKQNIRTAVLNGREKFKGTDTAYAKSLGIDSMAYGQIKDGMIENILSLGQWLNIGSKFQTAKNDYEMELVKTEVYLAMEDNFNFCQATKFFWLKSSSLSTPKTIRLPSSPNFSKKAWYC